ncbi:NAD-dependent epimerase/dehydratase family protein [Achromobacter xylosoxidans]
MRILVIGGTGFIGTVAWSPGFPAADSTRSWCPPVAMAAGGICRSCPASRSRYDDVHDDATLDRLLRGCDAAVNLVGILHGKAGKPYGSDFARAHVTLPQRVAQACRRQGVRRLLHMSALGADSAGASMYQRSKGDGEAAVRKELEGWRDGGWTIFRPSVVFGPDDNFTNLFARLARWLPVLPLAGAHRACSRSMWATWWPR